MYRRQYKLAKMLLAKPGSWLDSCHRNTPMFFRRIIFAGIIFTAIAGIGLVMTGCSLFHHHHDKQPHFPRKPQVEPGPMQPDPQPMEAQPREPEPQPMESQ